MDAIFEIGQKLAPFFKYKEGQGNDVSFDGIPTGSAILDIQQMFENLNKYFESQHAMFNLITQWLRNENFNLRNIRTTPNPSSELKFYCEVRVYETKEDFFKILIGTKTKDSVLLQATVLFNKLFVNSFNMTPKDKKNKLGENIRKNLIPLGVTFKVISSPGSIEISKSVPLNLSK